MDVASIVSKKGLLLTSLLLIFMTVPSLPGIAQSKANICTEAKGTDIFLDIFTWVGNHPMFEEDGGRIVFGDGKQGTRPHNSKHDEEPRGHVVFGDGEHGVMTAHCTPDSTAD